jgi:hypothetical protein
MSALSPAQRIFLLACFLGWTAFAIYAPENVSVDVYFFRDAACNWVQGGGFRTASLEKSVSFNPVLYSSYPPLSLWSFIPFAAIFGCTWRAASMHTIVLTTLGNLFVLAAGLRVATTPLLRWLLVALVGLTLPLGFLLGESDRPEELTFLLLATLLWLLGRRKQTVAGFAVQGLLAGLAFLSEPFGGVISVLAIAGAALGRALYLQRDREDARNANQLPIPDWNPPVATRLRRFFTRSLIAAVFFVLPLALTVAIFQHQDPTALARFERHARLAGTDRALHYGMSADTNEEEAREPKASLPQKIHNALRFQIAKGPIYELQLVGLGLTALLGLLLALSSPLREAWPVWAMLAIGLLLPWLTFPMQDNYHTLGEAAVPLALALGWAGYRLTRTRERTLLFAIFAVQLLCLLPNALVQFIFRVDARSSALAAAQQARFVGQYMQSHGLGNTVLLVPPPDYYLYKPAHPNLYNPNYYSKREGMAQVGGVLTCKTSTLDFSEIPVPPTFSGDWNLIAKGGPPVAVTLLHHQVMHRNWSYGCDAFVRAPR